MLKGDKYDSLPPEKTFFGQERQGDIIFFDALPKQAPSIEVDLMNPHYPEYYQDSDNKKNIAPTDFQNPVPIPFLTVANTNFQFFIGTNDNSSTNEGILNEVKKLLVEALQNHGIGAKTAVGYGRMYI